MEYKKRMKMIDDLRNEIIRLGIEDKPSKTIYNNERNKDISPAASTVLHTLDMTWSELMQLIGFRYDGITLEKDKEYLSDGFPEMTFDERKEYLLSKIDSIGLTLNGWYEILNIVDRGNTPNKMATSSKRDRYVSKKFKELDYDDKLDSLIDYLHENNIKNSVDYNRNRDKGSTPSLSYINSNFGGWKNVTRIYTKKYGKDLKNE